MDSFSDLSLEDLAEMAQQVEEEERPFYDISAMFEVSMGDTSHNTLHTALH